MRWLVTGAAALVFLSMSGPRAQTSGGSQAPVALVLHGGAGAIRKDQMPPGKEAAYRETLAEAARAGWDILQGGGSSLDAVETAVRILEDSPLFNAGKGAVFNHEGAHELDASIMDGATLRAGAVAGVRRVKNPVVLARRVMERSPHVFLVAQGAEAFAREQGVDLVLPSFFDTEERWRDFQRARAREQEEGRGGPPGGTEPPPEKRGTVGAVALDRCGHLAAATSTGGMTNKRWGRVGDSPVIGAGTYADDSACAVSATGWGEYFIRAAVAHDIRCRVAYRGESLQSAADAALAVVEALGGDGGVVALDARGNRAVSFNTPGMFRAWVEADGTVTVRLYEDP
ncbi:MAG: isoaspartyl peptidase/L-asparaginase family protein [Acidobacteriota bacterium]